MRLKIIVFGVKGYSDVKFKQSLLQLITNLDVSYVHSSDAPLRAIISFCELGIFFKLGSGAFRLIRRMDFLGLLTREDESKGCAGVC